MKRVVLVALCLACAVGAAWGGEVLKDDEGRALVPVAKLNCAPLFEVKDVRMTLCRVAGTPEYAIVVSVVFIHRASSRGAVGLTCAFKENAGDIFKTGTLDTYCDKVKPLTLTKAMFLARVAKWSSGCETGRFTPTITCTFTR